MKFLRNLLRGFLGFFKNLPELFRLLLRLPRNLWLFHVYLFRHGVRCVMPRCRCKGIVNLTSEVYKRADPMLYSQQWLMSQGMSVTWDNPDIQLYLNNTPVSSSLLQRNTEYEVRVRVWNNSYDAPAPGLPVFLSFLGFGAGATSIPVGKRIIDLVQRELPSVSCICIL